MGSQSRGAAMNRGAPGAQTFTRVVVLDPAGDWIDEQLGAPAVQSPAHRPGSREPGEIGPPWSDLTGWLDSGFLCGSAGVCGPTGVNDCCDTAHQQSVGPHALPTVATMTPRMAPPPSAHLRAPAFQVVGVPSPTATWRATPESVPPIASSRSHLRSQQNTARTTASDEPGSAASTDRKHRRSMPTVLPHTPVAIPANAEAVISGGGHLHLVDDPAGSRKLFVGPQTAHNLSGAAPLPPPGWSSKPRSSDYVAFEDHRAGEGASPNSGTIVAQPHDSWVRAEVVEIEPASLAGVRSTPRKGHRPVSVV